MPILQPSLTRIGSGFNAVGPGTDIYALAGSGGATGATGPAGPAGATGATGPQGPPGTIPNDISCTTLTTTGDVLIGGQVSVDGALDVSGAVIGSGAAFTGVVQANTANINNVTAATSILYVSAPGGVQVANDLTMTNASTLFVSDVELTGPDARISLNDCFSDPVITTTKVVLDTNGVAPGGSVSYVLNFSSDTPNNWDSGLYAVNCTLTVGGANVPYYQGMFSYSPNNVATIFNAYSLGFGLQIGADAFGNPILEFFNNSASTWATTSNLKITKLC